MDALLNPEVLAAVLSGVFAVLAAIFGNKWRDIKKLLNLLIETIEDDTLTKEDIKRIERKIKKLL